jgi:hypothetical protein
MAPNKVDLASPSPPPDFVPFQLAKLVKSPPTGDRWLHEIKFDGYRLQARIVDGQASFHTRNGHDWTHYFPVLAAAARSLPDCILHGELCALSPSGYSDCSALRSAPPGRTDDLVLYAFDILWPGHDGDLRSESLTNRKDALAMTLISGDELAQRKYVPMVALAIPPPGASWHFGPTPPVQLIAAANFSERTLYSVRISRRFVDPPLAGLGGYLKPGLDEDGEHLSSAGYAIWRAALLPQMPARPSNSASRSLRWPSGSFGSSSQLPLWGAKQSFDGGPANSRFPP